MVAHTGNVSGRVFYAHNPRQFRKLTHGLRRHIDDRAARNIVDHDRQIAAVMQLAVMRQQAPLRRLVVVWRHNEARIRAGFLGELHETHGFDGVVGPGPRDHRNTTRHYFDDLFDHGLMLFVGQSRAFTRCPDRHQTMRAFADMPLDQLLERIQIQLAVLERRDECRHRPFEHNTLLCCAIWAGRPSDRPEVADPG